jgi:hypothetical protein
MNPTPITISSPQLLDAACKQIGDVLKANLSWLTSAYGLSEKRERLKDNVRTLYPAIYCGGGEHLKMLPDEHLGNFCYFDVQDGYQVESIPRKYWRLEATVGLVFWFDLRKVYPTTFDANTDENVKAAVLTALQKTMAPTFRFTVTRVYDRSENIYRGYTLSEIDNQFLMRPYGGFRLEGTLVYENACP